MAIKTRKNKANRVFRKNLFLVTVFVVILTIISTSIYLITDNNAKNNRIELLESEEMGKTKTALSHMLEEVANSCVYFSTITFNINLGNENYDYNLITQVKKQMDVVLATFNSVENIIVMSHENDLTLTSNQTNERISIDELDLKLLGTVKDAYIYYNCGKIGSELYMIKSAETDPYVSNDVIIGINADNLCDAVFFSGKDERRNEFLVDENGNIIMSNNLYIIKSTLNEHFEIKFNPYKQKGFQFEFEGKEYLLSVRQASGLNAYLVAVVDLDLYDSMVTEGNTATLILILAFMISSIIIIYLIFSRTYKPINDIMSQLGEISIVTPESDDEIQYIKQNLQKYNTSNSELSQLVEEKIKELQVQHISALQSQICPHFTYNTLDAINWIAYRIFDDRNNEISFAIKRMSQIFYSCMDLSGFFRTVKDEIDITLTYIEILKIRIKNAFEVTFDVDETILEQNILKLSIQPLVENISLHAMGDYKTKVNIFIAVKEDGDFIKVTVKDDGVGIDSERLTQLKSAINDFSITGEKHIGLKNVNERLKLIYGEDAGLVIESVVGEGTICTFRYPKM